MNSIVDVLVPLNEEGTRATILRWCKLVGDTVLKDEPLVELETDKVTVEIAAPCDGTLIEILKPVDAEVMPDDVVARLSLHGESTGRREAEPANVNPAPRGIQAAHDAPTPLSPSVRRLLHEHSIAATDVVGTGRNGRITAQDVTRHMTGAGARTAADSAAPAPVPGSQKGNTRVPHTAIRRRIAEHMARSLTDAPHVTTLFEADLTRVLEHRASHAGSYQSRGARLTLTSYFIGACVRALGTHPEVNATFHQDALELHGDVNIGVGTALGNEGLIVPVIHGAQKLDLFGMARRLDQMVQAARAGRLKPEDVRGGTFTISNHGVGGSLLAAPIVINQPQVAILGVGKLQRRVCVVQADKGEAIGVRSMCYLTLTIDHRALDAFQANAFLALVVSTLENWPDEES